MKQARPELETIELSELSDVTGGGKWGTAWKALKAGYKASKPFLDHALPIGSIALKARSIWNRAHDDRYN